MRARRRWLLVLGCCSVGWSCATASSGPGAVPDQEAPGPVATSPEPQGADGRWRVPISDRPCRGPATAPVTVVEFSDFECQHCARAQETLAALESRYPGKLRVCFRHRPLPLHFFARDAAEAAEAAGSQGRFWEMHDLLFAQQEELSVERLHLMARQLDLDLERFERDRLSEAIFARVDQDEELAVRLAVRSAPTFFINGRRIDGAQPLATFEEVVRDGLTEAEELIADGVPASEVYGALGKRPADAVPTERLALAGGLPVQPEDPCRGSTSAPVTLVEFTDFECPFCGMAKETLDAVEANYRDRVRLCIMFNPMSFHPHGRSTALTALAAHRQGKFFEVYGDLFAHQDALDDISVTLRMRALGLDVEQLERDVASAEVVQQLTRQIELARAADLRGTPTFVLGDEVVFGALPYPIFKAWIDRRLSEK